jgi:uncharacterized LabA/DUF88 family protein
MKNIAFIDGQNLHLGTRSSKKPWKVDLKKFRVYLEQKYQVHKAYYFLGFVQEANLDLYEEIQNSGFILIFREHNSAMTGKKKGNVDTDIVFQVMKKIYKKEDFDKIVIVSGDGDYKLLVDFLIEEDLFEKVLLPNREYASSLYKKLGRKYFAHLEDVIAKISK